jgi:hypothetical protein
MQKYFEMPRERGNMKMRRRFFLTAFHILSFTSKRIFFRKQGGS